MNEQEVTNKFLKQILVYIGNANDLLERQFILTVAEADVKKYVLSMEQFGLFDEWWKEEALQKEAKAFLKNPNEKTVSTLKQEVFGNIEGTVYTLFFHIRCNAQFYYKTIQKNKMSYLINNGRLIWMKLDKFDRENNRDIQVYEQGLNMTTRDPFAKIHHA
jgi:hypothetical protein